MSNTPPQPTHRTDLYDPYPAGTVLAYDASHRNGDAQHAGTTIEIAHVCTYDDDEYVYVTPQHDAYTHRELAAFLLEDKYPWRLDHIPESTTADT